MSCGMTREPLRRCWRKCRYLGGECCVQRKRQVQKPCGRTCKWKSPRCCPNAECPTDIYNAGVILSPSFPSHRVHPKSCWLCFRHLHPICALLCSYPGRAFLTSCVVYGDSLLTGLPPATLPMPHHLPPLKRKTNPRLTLSRNPACHSWSRKPLLPMWMRGSLPGSCPPLQPFLTCSCAPCLTHCSPSACSWATRCFSCARPLRFLLLLPGLLFPQLQTGGVHFVL